MICNGQVLRALTWTRSQKDGESPKYAVKVRTTDNLDPVLGLRDIDFHPVTDEGWKNLTASTPTSAAELVAAPSASASEVKRAVDKACVFAPDLTRRSILDALRARHCYGTTAAKIFLDVRVNGRLMGEKIAEPASGPVTVEIVARCPGKIDRIEICRNHRFIYSKQPEGREASLTFVDREPLFGRSYYYVRVIQKDEEIAWSSPVWFGAK